MSPERKRRVAALVLLLLFVAVVCAAGESAPSSSSSSGQTAAAGALPAGFGSDSRENPFRRFEIIAFGAFPIMLFYADFGFDLRNYLAHGFDYRYAPWPFKSNSYSVDPSQGELFLRIGAAAGLSLAFAGADAIIRSLKPTKSAARPSDASN